MARVLAWRAPQYATLLLITLLSCTHSQAFFFNKPSKPAADGGSGGAQGGAVASATGNAASGAASAGIGQQTLHNQPTHYYYNTLTGETQWDPPGELPFEDEAGQRVEWIDGQLHAGHNQLLWREVHSEEHGRPYYYNVETGESVWEKPEMLSWKRVRYEPEL